MTPSLPAGLSHTPDTASMTPAERREHHRRELQNIGYCEGTEGIARYRKQHPDAAGIQVKMQSIGYVPKPKGYAECLTQMASHWLDSIIALASTNAADVRRLNVRLGSSFPEASHFSKPLPGYILTAIAEACADRGVALHKAANSMGKIRKAIRAGTAKTTPGATPIAGLGHRNGSTLTSGSENFAIERHHEHDCIRVMVDGQRVRLRLDALAAFVSMTGLGHDVPRSYLLRSRIGDTAPDPDLDPLKAPNENAGAISTEELGATSTGEGAVSLSGRIAALCQPDRRAPTIDDATDPLEL